MLERDLPNPALHWAAALAWEMKHFGDKCRKQGSRGSRSSPSCTPTRRRRRAGTVLRSVAVVPWPPHRAQSTTPLWKETARCPSSRLNPPARKLQMPHFGELQTCFPSATGSRALYSGSLAAFPATPPTHGGTDGFSEAVVLNYFFFFFF